MRVVKSLDELLRLPADARVNGFRVRETLQIEIPWVARAATLRAQEALNHLQYRGGSFAAAGFMFVTLVLGMIEVFHRNSSMFARRAAFELAVVLTIAFAAGLLAKYAALAVTRWQFANRCREQHRELSGMVRVATLVR